MPPPLPPPLFPPLRPVICVALSGGVDSAVVGSLLSMPSIMSRYHPQLLAVHMTNWEDPYDDSQCSSSSDLAAAEAVARHLRLPFHHFSFTREYWNDVFQGFLHGYECGLTPNPDVQCNREIKFRSLWEAVKKHFQADFIATGHYARNQFNWGKLDTINGRSFGGVDSLLNEMSSMLENAFSALPNVPHRLLSSFDNRKDQSYYISMVRDNALSHVLFPLGNLTKTSVRLLASKQFALPNAKREDSHGICFIGKKKFGPFLSEYIHMKEGYVNDINGKMIGRHRGSQMYTIGQSIGVEAFPLAIVRSDPDVYASPPPSTRLYVYKKDVLRNEVFVVPQTTHPAMYNDELYVRKMNWINHSWKERVEHIDNSGTSIEVECWSKLRSTERKKKVKVKLERRRGGGGGSAYSDRRMSTTNPPTSGATPSSYEPISDNFPDLEYCISSSDIPLHMVAPGQIVALYDGDECIAGGVIDRSGPSYYDMGKAVPDAALSLDEWKVFYQNGSTSSASMSSSSSSSSSCSPSLSSLLSSPTTAFLPRLLLSSNRYEKSESEFWDIFECIKMLVDKEGNSSKSSALSILIRMEFVQFFSEFTNYLTFVESGEKETKWKEGRLKCDVLMEFGSRMVTSNKGDERQKWVEWTNLIGLLRKRMEVARSDEGTKGLVNTQDKMKSAAL